MVNFDIHLNKGTAPMGLRLVHARPERENFANDSNDRGMDRTDETISLVCDFLVIIPTYSYRPLRQGRNTLSIPILNSIQT